MGSMLLIVERLLPERIECCEAHREITMMDLHMLVMPGGRERTGVEYARALRKRRPRASIQTKQTGSPFAIMQARKIDARTSRDDGFPRRGASPMNRGSIVLAGAGVLCLGAIVSAADADTKYDIGASSSEIRIGQTMPPIAAPIRRPA